MILKELVEHVKEGDTHANSLHEVLVGEGRVFLLLNCAVKVEQLVVGLSIAQLGGPRQMLDCFVKVLRNTSALLVKDAHPMSADEATKLLTVIVKLSSLLNVSLDLILCVGELSKSVVCSGAFSLLGNTVESSLNFLQVGLLRKSDVIVYFEFNGGQMLILHRSLDPVDTLFLVAWHRLLVSALNLQLTKHVSCVVSSDRVLLDD